MGGRIAVAADDGSEFNIAAVVGDNLRRLRTRSGLSLERLAKASGVSRAMLGQIELGRSAPTVGVLWKIARALDVPFATFTVAPGSDGVRILRAHRAKWLTSKGGRFASRALSPQEGPRREEFYEVRLAPQTIDEADPHPPGTMENLVVAKGGLDVVVAGDWHRLSAGDAILFQADVPHAYRNSGVVETVFYLVMTYSEHQG